MSSDQRAPCPRLVLFLADGAGIQQLLVHARVLFHRSCDQRCQRPHVSRALLHGAGGGRLAATAAHQTQVQGQVHWEGTARSAALPLAGPCLLALLAAPSYPQLVCVLESLQVACGFRFVCAEQSGGALHADERMGRVEVAALIHALHILMDAAAWILKHSRRDGGGGGGRGGCCRCNARGGKEGLEGRHVEDVSGGASVRHIRRIRLASHSGQ